MTFSFHYKRVIDHGDRGNISPYNYYLRKIKIHFKTILEINLFYIFNFIFSIKYIFIFFVYVYSL